MPSLRRIHHFARPGELRKMIEISRAAALRNRLKRIGIGAALGGAIGGIGYGVGRARALRNLRRVRRAAALRYGAAGLGLGLGLGGLGMYAYYSRKKHRRR